MTDMMLQLKQIGIIPVVVLYDKLDAVPLAECLMEGGLPCAEVTFRTPVAEESIRLMAKTFPEMIIQDNASEFNLKVLLINHRTSVFYFPESS